uniref:Uncharacterized protein n=1 Tax=Klebsiella pneumoniae TaxID=573 RepID=U5N6F9_KLEPN|nr:hypothetical protein pN11x00042NDM_022 [Klebsiella pneumoniae]
MARQLCIRGYFTPRNQPCATLFQPCFESGCRFDFFHFLLFPGFYRACTERRTEKFTDRLVSPKTSFQATFTYPLSMPFIARLGSSIYCIVIKPHGHGTSPCTSTS